MMDYLSSGEATDVIRSGAYVGGIAIEFSFHHRKILIQIIHPRGSVAGYSNK